MEANVISYCEKRLKELGVTPEKNVYKVVNEEGRTISHQFFTKKNEDDISINYLTIDGFVQCYKDKTNTGIKDFSRTRLKEPKDGKKYLQPKATENYPFPTPIIIDAYRSKTKVKTLYLVEGEFKAFSLYLNEIMCMGIGGIFNYKAKETFKLHPDILRFCKDCEVENVVLLMDADARQIKWGELEKEKTDVFERANNFYCALWKFNDLLKPYDIDLYFATINKDSEFKGIDDLLMSNGGKNKDKILHELTSFLEESDNRKFIDTYKISGHNATYIKGIFGINKVQDFYELHKEELENKDFVFKGDTYFIDEKGKAVVSWNGKEKYYFKVGNEFYRKTVRSGVTTFDIVKRSTIKEKLKTNSNEIFNQIEIFDSFDYEPENDPKAYRRKIVETIDGITSENYNLYEPVRHVPKKGNHDNINKYFRHIFNYKTNSGDDCLEIALDYITLLYTKPKQPLPVLCLVSTERGTGKTTFSSFLQRLFGGNVCRESSEDFTSKFNDMEKGKLVICIEEANLNFDDKNSVADKIKSITTDDSVNIEGKGKDRFTMRNFSKIVLMSNCEKDFIKIPEEEDRYWIIKVSPIPKEEKDGHILEKMENEIPAFLFYLLNERQMKYKNKGRLWFDETIYRTPALDAIIERMQSPYLKSIKNAVIEQAYFLGETKIRLSLKVLYDLIKQDFKDCNKNRLKDFLSDKGYSLSNPTNFIYKDEFEGGEISKKDRVFTFDLLNPDETLFKNFDLETFNKMKQEQKAKEEKEALEMFSKEESTEEQTKIDW